MRFPVEDRASARERTALSWQRTALLFGTLAGIALVAAARRSELVAGLPIAVLLGALSLGLRSHGRRLYVARRAGGVSGADVRGVQLVTGATLLAAAVLAGLVIGGR